VFNWLRLKFRNAALAGINDAIEILERQGANDHDDALGLLEERVRLLPGPGDDRPAERQRGARKGRSA
jgi:hypothetical protein